MALSLRNPQLERLTATPESRTYTVAIVTIVVVVLLLFFAIRPSVSSVLDRLNENSDKRKYIDQLEQKRINLTTLTSAETSQATQLQLLDSAFPEERKENEVLDNLDKLAKASSLDLKDVVVTITEEKSNIDTVLDVNTQYAVVSVQVSGVRSNIWGFVEDLESSNRILNLQKVGISSRIDESGNISQISDSEIVFEIYYYKQQNV